MRQRTSVGEITQDLNQLQTAEQALAAQRFVFLVIFLVDGFQAHSENLSSVEPPTGAAAKSAGSLPGMLPQGPHQVKTERRFIVCSGIKIRNISPMLK
jgi:hypothetical protein